MNKEVTYGCGSLDALQARRHTPEVGDGNGFSSKGCLDGMEKELPGAHRRVRNHSLYSFGTRVSLLLPV